MNTPLLIIAIMGSLHAAAAPEVKGEQSPTRKNNEEIMKIFDRNHDGILDDAERAAMRTAMGKQRMEAQKDTKTAPPGPAPAPAASNGNATPAGNAASLSPVGENATAILEAADPNQDLVQKKLARHRAFVMTFDADKDGKLNEAERKTALEAVRLRR
jgi:hypothetical protein